MTLVKSTDKKFEEDEVIEKVLEFNIKVQTNKGKEKTIHISDIVHHISSSLAMYDDEGVFKIEFKMDCLGYAKEITQNKF